jgi:hypothetical protein
MYNFIDKTILYKNRITISITLFIFILFTIHYFKPNFIYNNDGSFTQFGIGYDNKTIFPIWLIIIILSLLCYISVMYFIIKLQ